MNSNKIYECPKCLNRLLYSNKLLHDLKCTKERPVQFSLENPTSSLPFNYGKYRDNSAPGSLRKISRNFSYRNEDGSTTEIKKDKNMLGKDELIEITYDPQGNIIGRKKAFGGRNNMKYNFSDILDYKEYNLPIITNYYTYEGNNVNEYINKIHKNYDYNNNIGYDIKNNYGYVIKNIQPVQKSFGSNNYSLMNNYLNKNINNIRVIKLNNNNSIYDKYYSSNNIYVNKNNYLINNHNNNIYNNKNSIYDNNYSSNNIYVNKNNCLINNYNNNIYNNNKYYNNDQVFVKKLSVNQNVQYYIPKPQNLARVIRLNNNQIRINNNINVNQNYNQYELIKSQYYI